MQSFISNRHDKKCTLQVDKNGYYIISRYLMYPVGWRYQPKGRELFKKIESAQNAINKWLNN